MTAEAPPRGQSLREHRPQWWLSVVAAVGWLVLSALFVTGHGGHSHDGAFATHVAAGLAMVAVMAPLIAVNVRFAALRSPRRARGAVGVDIATGWALVYAGAAVVIGGVAWLPAYLLGDLLAIAAVTVVAVVWQHMPGKRLSLARCHAVLSPPLDRRRSRRACQRYGAQLGQDCMRSCWALMTLMAVAAHNPFIVAALTGVAWYERRRRAHHDPATRTTSITIAATGVVALTTAALLTPA